MPGLDERLRQRGEQFDEAVSLVRRADRRLARKQTVDQPQLIARIRKLRRIEFAKSSRRSNRQKAFDIPERDALWSRAEKPNSAACSGIRSRSRRR